MLPKKILLLASFAASVLSESRTEQEAIAAHFPGALTGKAVQMQVAKAMESLAMTAANTVFAESSCPDELNHDNFAADISNRMGAALGEVFVLGGLAGVPFTGSAGWGAFSHHVPDGGNMFVMYAPHVGVTSDGKVGKVHRPGMSYATSACGSAIGAFNALKEDPSLGAGPPTYHDYQQSYMVQQLAPSIEAILALEGENNQQEELARETFKIVENVLEDIMSQDWMGPNSKLMLLGGIMINVDGKDNDLFLPLTFEVRDRDGNKNSLITQFEQKLLGESGLSAPTPNPKVDLNASWNDLMTGAQVKSVKKHFEKALPGSHVEQMAFDALKKLGFNVENTIYAESSCPDELNHDSDDDISNLMANRWGEAFPLGGLAGIPFTGKTGWGAFSHHVPDNGNTFALYAPHVGITSDGSVGHVHRPAMAKTTTACGAAVGAYNVLEGKTEEETLAAAEGSNRRLAGGNDAHNQQISYIVEELRPKMNKIQASNDFNTIMSELTYETYGVVKSYMDSIHNNKWMQGEKHGHLYPDSSNAALGGIMINMDGDGPDLFLPLHFYVVDKSGAVVDLMPETFGQPVQDYSKQKTGEHYQIPLLVGFLIGMAVTMIAVVLLGNFKCCHKKVLKIVDEPGKTERELDGWDQLKLVGGTTIEIDTTQKMKSDQESV